MSVLGTVRFYFKQCIILYVCQLKKEYINEINKYLLSHLLSALLQYGFLYICGNGYSAVILETCSIRSRYPDGLESPFTQLVTNGYLDLNQDTTLYKISEAANSSCFVNSMGVVHNDWVYGFAGTNRQKSVSSPNMMK